MDRLLESAFTPSPATWGTATGWGWDVYEDADNYYFQAYVPGVDPNAMEITLQDNVLSISGETRRNVPEQWRPVFQEMTFGQFRRQFTLGAPVESQKAEAAYEDGILKITLPKAETAKPKTIKVTANGARAAAR